jgi:DedD protein
MAEEKQDVETLKRRGRRRLVGALALVLAAVIVLPMVFDQEPRSTGSAVSTRIPGEDETPFKPKPPARKAEPAKKAEPVAKAEPVPEKAAATPPKEEYVVRVGAFTNPQGAIGKLKSAKLPYYTEALKDNRTGNLTRVHAGPFATREAAEKAVEQLKALGFRPGGVSSKSG